MHLQGNRSFPIALVLTGAGLGATFLLRLRKDTQPREHDDDTEDVQPALAKPAQQVRSLTSTA
jgi:hypothetical protein